MKKLLALLLVGLMLLSLCACGKANEQASQKATTETPAETAKPTEEPMEAQPEEVMLRPGDTVVGELCDITIQSVECVDKIKDGFWEHMWSPSVKDTYKDVTAEEGYSIVKIVYSFDFKGKEKGHLRFDFTLDYDDGYTFDGFGGHAVPIVRTSGLIGFEEKYVTGAKTQFEVNDPLTYKGDTAVKYIIVNDEVISNTDKPLVLKVSVPTAMYQWEYDANYIGTLTAQKEDETFVFDLR